MYKRMLGTACCSQEEISSNKWEEDELVLGGKNTLARALVCTECGQGQWPEKSQSEESGERREHLK